MNNYDLNRCFLVVGAGGLGCFMIEGLLRFKVKKIIVCDPDVFSISNLNRQLYSLPTNIGEYKVEVARKRAIELNYPGEFVIYKQNFDSKMLEGVDVVIDCLDNIKDRLLLEDSCAINNLPLIHGAVEGNVYEVAISMPRSNLLHNIYQNIKEPKEKHTNFLTCEACSSKQLALALKKPKEYFEVFEID